ncbi:type II toxin-antitoxin system RelE/ParE family toxin [Leuconostoc citreum]|jgi:mRNA interferase RelE/StbE|nr:type II toxin-antitoxin system RelE/ParE family toxin [Leuconostoc citreum]QOG10673.1 type II toxin-antitoxin system RelE/ParE family toxin [Leuconostoc sp. LN180020]CCF25259.1 Addiction module toxin, RelE/StbE family [Leuconostoc citreum LBAE C10]CCF27427.1 Addiction module toxin, RelE/StbE family [Leuconostoc citreum LBAE C11]MCT3054729.1 type II toxin-antitoxin system RelE/ParE family toxin [Leuconostoc citreum]MCT3062935.1 type II toxin-antitoxin system RelE/ParE family toxin [Leuconost
MYRVTFTKQALKQLKKLDKFTQSTIYQWLQKNLDGTDNPRAHGKGLTANHSGEWRYRVGDYRILANIKDDEIIIEVFTIGHRRDIY